MSYTSLNEALEIFAQIADARGEQYRALAYRRAIVDPTSVGSDLARKIAEYRATRHIRELDELLSQPDIKAWLSFDKILGFGPSTIRGLVAANILTRADLIDAVKRQKIELTRTQDLGLRFFDDLQRKIPREDVALISEQVFVEIYRAAHEVLEQNERILVVTAGSYRRQARESSDIDILIAPDSQPARKRTARSAEFGRGLLQQIHKQISQLPAFIDVIMIGNQKYSFLYRFHWVVSIDIIYVPREAYFAALLYFTGSQSFNIWMRELCKKKGYSLNQYGLTASDGSVIQLKSEEHLFEILGIPYIPPQNRNKPPPQMP